MDSKDIPQRTAEEISQMQADYNAAITSFNAQVGELSRHERKNADYDKRARMAKRARERVALTNALYRDAIAASNVPKGPVRLTLLAAIRVWWNSRRRK